MSQNKINSITKQDHSQKSDKISIKISSPKMNPLLSQKPPNLSPKDPKVFSITKIKLPLKPSFNLLSTDKLKSFLNIKNFSTLFLKKLKIIILLNSNLKLVKISSNKINKLSQKLRLKIKILTKPLRINNNPMVSNFLMTSWKQKIPITTNFSPVIKKEKLKPFTKLLLTITKSLISLIGNFNKKSKTPLKELFLTKILFLRSLLNRSLTSEQA